MLDYLAVGVTVLGVVVTFFGLLPMLASNKGLKKYADLISIAVEVVKAIEQEFKTETPDANDPEYLLKKLELAKAKKAACKKAILDILTMYKMPIPTDAILDRAIEVGVWAMNEGKKYLEKR